MNFKGVVDDPVMIGGKIVIPRGASGDAAGGQGRAVGQDEGQRQDHAEAEHVSFGGMVHEVATKYVEAEGQGRRQEDRAASRPAAPALARSSAGSPAAARARRSARPSAA